MLKFTLFCVLSYYFVKENRTRENFEPRVSGGGGAPLVITGEPVDLSSQVGPAASRVAGDEDVVDAVGKLPAYG